MPELAHAGIDDRNASAAPLPGLQCNRIDRCPIESCKARVEILVGGVREVMQQVIGKVAPAKLPDIGIDFCAIARSAMRLQGAGDPPRRNFAEVQMRRQLRGADAIGAIAVFAISRQRAVDKDLQHFVRAGFAGLPVLPEALVPLQARHQLQRVERIGLQARRQRRQATRRVHGGGQLQLRQRIAPERVNTL